MFGEILIKKQRTIKELSEGAGVPRSTIADLISGKTSVDRMSAGNLYKLSHFLNLNMEDLFVYCCLPVIDSEEQFITEENNKIIEHGLKPYVKELAQNNLVETSYALRDRVRFQKYMSAVRDYYKYRKLTLPERYSDYVTHLEG